MATDIEHCGFAEFGETMLGKRFYPKQKELLNACKLGGYVGGLPTKAALLSLEAGEYSDTSPAMR